MRAARTLILIAAVWAVAACEGNLFPTDGAPELVTFTATPDSVAEGDTVSFRVVAEGVRNIASVQLSLTGAMTSDITHDLESPAPSVDETIRVVVGAATPDPEITARAWVIDVSDAESDTLTATVAVADTTPPSASVTATPAEVGAGQTITMVVTATDNRGVDSVGVIVSHPSIADTRLVADIDTPADSVTHEFTLEAPATDIGEITITPLAWDVTGNAATEAEAVAIGLTDLQGPTFLSFTTTPDSTIPLGAPLRVTVQVADPAGIRQVTFIGLAYRGEPTEGTDSVVERYTQKTIELPRPTEADTLPKLYTLNPELASTDEEAEPVEIIVIAEDSLGNVSDTTKFVFVGGPDVRISYPVDGDTRAVGAMFNVKIDIEDGSGIDSAKLILTSDAGEDITDLTIGGVPGEPFDQTIEQSVTLPSTEGVVDLRAIAWNTEDVAGQSQRVTLNVVENAPTDSEPPTVALTVERLVPVDADERMELLDELRVRVTASDGNSGLARIGLTSMATRAGAQDTVREDQVFSASLNEETLTFQVTVDSLFDLLGVDPSAAARDSILPEDIVLNLHGFAADDAGNVACTVGDGVQRDCRPDGYSSTEFYEASGATGLVFRIDAVRGRTVLLANSQAVIADLVFDTLMERLYMSDINSNLVWGLPVHSGLESLVADSQFSVPVGAAPWGLFIGERSVGERMLIVANSGGTNMSFVDISVADPDLTGEVDAFRLLTPNALLRTLNISSDEFGNTRYSEAEVIDFSDRPQFIAQDSLRRIVYSTVGTEAAPITSLRYVITDPAPAAADDEPEVRFIINESMINTDVDTRFAIANVDEVLIREIEGASDSVSFVGHVPGYPDDLIITPFFAQAEEAADFLNDSIQTVMTNRGDGAQAGMYFADVNRGDWDLQAIAMSDTTFVTASGDGGRIAIGEGAQTPTGRIIMWFAEPASVTSSAIEIADLVNNASEEVRGVALNQDGSLGVARGREATYFFTPDLRLQGLYDQAAQGGAGAAFHPGHDDVFDGADETAASGGFAFTGTSEQSVEVVNTFHFYQVSELPIRDNIVGPLRVGPPLRDEATCVGDGCVVAKLYGITSAGGVVVLNIRRRDLQ